MAGAVPDITPYFSQTYAQGMENARTKIKADLERELARERAAAQMAQTLVGGAFNIGGQLGSAALAHYLKEPLESAKGGVYGFERAHGAKPRDAYLGAIDPQLQAAAEMRAAPEIAAMEAEMGTGETIASLPAGASKDDLRGAVELGEGQGAPGMHTTLEEFQSIPKGRGLEITEGGGDIGDSVRAAAAIKHLERMRGVVRSGGPLAQELAKLKIEIPTFQEFKQAPAEHGVKPTSARSGELYNLSRRVNAQANLEMSQIYWKKGQADATIRLTAEAKVAKQIKDTNPNKIVSSGLSANSWQRMKMVKANDLNQRYGLVSDEKGRLYLRFDVYGDSDIAQKLVTLPTPLTRTQIEWLKNDIAFAVESPLTASEFKVRHANFKIAMSLKGAGRMSVKIFNGQKRDKEDPPIWRYNSGPGDKSPIDVRHSDVSGALAAPLDPSNADSITNVDAIMQWLETPKNKMYKIGDKTTQGAGVTDQAELARIEADLKFIQSQEPGTEERIDKLFGKGKGYKVNRKYQLGLRMFVRNHQETHRGDSIQALKGSVDTTIAPTAVETKVSNQYTATFGKAEAKIASAGKSSVDTAMSTVKAEFIKPNNKRRNNVKITIGKKVYAFTVKGDGWKKYNKQFRVADFKVWLKNYTSGGTEQFKSLQLDAQKAAARKHLPGAILNWKNIIDTHKLPVDKGWELFNRKYPYQGTFSIDDFKNVFDGKDLGAVMNSETRNPVASMDDDRVTKALKAIARMNISDKEKNRRLNHFLTRMGA